MSILPFNVRTTYNYLNNHWRVANAVKSPT